MKKTNPALKQLMIACFSAMLFSCNNSTETAKDEPKAADSTVAVPTMDVAFTPFKVMLIKHSVVSYEKWKPAYDSHDSARKAYGLTDLDLLTDAQNSNKVLIVEKIADVQKAKEFTTLSNLKEAMQKAGVIGVPEFAFYNVVSNDDSKIDTKDRVMITHRVKDFEAWVKVFDAEGKATRASEGMVDRVLARGIDDPNIVHIVFAVTDMAKAKAAIISEKKKNLMMSAGVEGMPVIEFYKQVN